MYYFIDGLIQKTYPTYDAEYQNCIHIDGVDGRHTVLSPVIFY